MGQGNSLFGASMLVRPANPGSRQSLPADGEAKDYVMRKPSAVAAVLAACAIFTLMGVNVGGCQHGDFWCRKKGAFGNPDRECFGSQARCERDAFGRARECFSTREATCFSAEVGMAGGGVMEMLCTPTREECDDWLRNRRGTTGPKCITLKRSEYSGD